MKRKINEENYNEQIEIGVAQDKFQAKAIVNMLKKEGIDAYSDGNSVFILAERDSNDPHYVDDIKQYAIEKFNEFCGDSKQPMKLACSKQKNMKITESKLRNLIKESVKKALKESDIYDKQLDLERQQQAWFQEEKELCEKLVDFLQKKGVSTANVGQLPSGLPVVQVDTDEYFEKKVNTFAMQFAESRHMYASSQTYPATTHIRLNKY
jgi:hypothetical protein